MQLELEDIQAIVVHGYVRRPCAVYALLEIDPDQRDQARASLHSLASRVEPATPSARQAEKASGDDKPPPLSIAFSVEGLQALGLQSHELESFLPEFRQGMSHAHRARVLGDTGVNAPERWLWGHGERRAHALVSAFAADEGRLRRFVHDELERAPGLAVVHQRMCKLIREPVAAAGGAGPARSFVEPFGFRDGVSQPYVAGFRGSRPNEHPDNEVAAGEFVLGYPNELDVRAQSPRVSATEHALRHLPRLDAEHADLGRNGTFLAVRDLEQDVARFSQLSDYDAAKLIGRWRSGAPLALSPHRDDPGLSLENSFSYYAHDRSGLRCPLGAHVRRANPRDALSDPLMRISTAEAGRSVNLHRIVRRGRPYSDGEAHGLFFIGINANIERQFEFTQQSWMANPGFASLTDEIDPTIGRATTATIPRAANPRRLSLEQYITVRGGGYFFLPGLSALRYLTTLQMNTRE